MYIAKIVIFPANDLRAPGAGGVSPPWFRKRACKCVSSTLQTIFARPHSRRADAWRYCSSVRGYRAVLVFCGTTFVLPAHGGLTPAALDRMCVCASQKSLFFRRTIAVHQERTVCPRGVRSAAGGDSCCPSSFRDFDCVASVRAPSATGSVSCRPGALAYVAMDLPTRSLLGAFRAVLRALAYANMDYSPAAAWRWRVA
jgi:hypothetical protein